MLFGTFDYFLLQLGQQVVIGFNHIQVYGHGHMHCRVFKTVQ
jgi:hypothetical protein